MTYNCKIMFLRILNKLISQNEIVNAFLWWDNGRAGEAKAGSGPPDVTWTYDKCSHDRTPSSKENFVFGAHALQSPSWNCGFWFCKRSSLGEWSLHQGLGVLAQQIWSVWHHIFIFLPPWDRSLSFHPLHAVLFLKQEVSHFHLFMLEFVYVLTHIIEV